MTEAEWLAGEHPYDMIYFKNCRSARKRRLLACACARRVSHLVSNERFHDAIRVSERYADCEASDIALRAARKDLKRAFADLEQESLHELTANVYRCLQSTLEKEFMSFKMAIEESQHIQAHLDRLNWDRRHREEAIHQCALVRDIFGPLPFRFIAITPTVSDWNDGAIVKLARGIYDDRTFDSLLILADALEDAGCDSADILAHCRGPGPHVRGCWVIDLLLGKS